MKYTNEVRIAVPRDRVVALFEDVENLKHWQPGFVSFEQVSGAPGQAGSKARLVYTMGKRETAKSGSTTSVLSPRRARNAANRHRRCAS
jgi:carbon monoxide dehydrogenase subunit G